MIGRAITTTVLSSKLVNQIILSQEKAGLKSNVPHLERGLPGSHQLTDSHESATAASVI